MNHTARLSLIATLCSGASAPLVASIHEVREEVSLAAAHNDSESTLDEGENITELSPLMLDRIETVKEQFGSESLDLTPAERAEIGVPLFRAKLVQNLVSEDDAEFRAFKRDMGWE